MTPTTMEKRNLRKERIGVVSSNKGDKTITVTIRWKEKHPWTGRRFEFRSLCLSLSLSEQDRK